MLILGARAPVAVEWARAFALSGWQVMVGDSLRFPLARFSRFTSQFLRLPPVAQCFSAWQQALQQAVRQEKIDYILPTCEEALYLAQVKDQLGCEVGVAESEQMQTLHDKFRFSQWLAQQSSLTTPETHWLTDGDEVVPLMKEARQWVFKPVFSRFAWQTLIAPDAQKLKNLKPTKAQPWVAQRFIQGTEYCSYSILHHGTMTAHACYQPKYRVGQGAGIYFQPCVFPEIEAFVRHLGAMMGYHGQIAFDFIRDDSGRFWVLECNPRATSGVHLLGAQPQDLVSALLGKGKASMCQYPKQIKMAMMLCAAKRYGGKRAFWQDVRQAQDALNYPEERALWAAQGLGVLELLWRSVRQRQNLLACSTHDIAWNGEQKDASVTH